MRLAAVVALAGGLFFAAPLARADAEPGLVLHGYVQADAVLYSEASIAEVAPSGTPENQTRLLIRRGRLEARYTRGVAGAALELDANTTSGPTARLVGAEVFVAWRGAGEATGDAGGPPLVEGALGLMKIPFGREVLESDRDRLFLERSNTATALFPGVRDLGLRVGGGWRQVRYALALMNGEPIGERAFPGLDPNPAKDLVGRLGLELAVGPVGLAAGVSGLRGTGLHRGTPATKDTLVWRDVNEDGIVQITEIQVIAGSAASPSAEFDRFALGGDLLVTLAWPGLGTTSVAAEIAWAQNLDRGVEPADPVTAGRDLRELGYHVLVTQELTRVALVGLRYDVYRPDRDAFDRSGAALVPLDDRYATLAVAAAVRPWPVLRVTLEYDHNWNALGRSASGQPTTLGSDLLTLRAQGAF